MILIVNGEERRLEAATLAELLTQLGFEGDWLATAVNGDFVAREERHGFSLNERDRVEILSPMQGG